MGRNRSIKTTSQILADQTRNILKKGVFYLKILEICSQINWEEYQHDFPFRTEMLNTEKKKKKKKEPPNRTETQNNENLNTTHTNISKQMLIQE